MRTRNKIKVSKAEMIISRRRGTMSSWEGTVGGDSERTEYRKNQTGPFTPASMQATRLTYSKRWMVRHVVTRAL